MEISQIASLAGKIKANVEKVIVSSGDHLDLLLTALIAGGHVLLDDVPGTGKTVTAKALAKSLGVDMKRIQFTPDLLPGSRRTWTPRCFARKRSSPITSRRNFCLWTAV